MHISGGGYDSNDSWSKKPDALPNNSRSQIPDLSRISLGDIIDALRWTNPVTFSGKLLQTTIGVEPNLFFKAGDL